jgi:hypothetical protein
MKRRHVPSKRLFIFDWLDCAISRKIELYLFFNVHVNVHKFAHKRTTLGFKVSEKNAVRFIKNNYLMMSELLMKGFNILYIIYLLTQLS